MANLGETIWNQMYHLGGTIHNSCLAKGSNPVKKICSYLDIVKIALTPPLPAVLDTYKELCRKSALF